MNRNIRVLLVTFVAAGANLSAQKQAQLPPTSNAAPRNALVASYADLPLSFEPNQGQTSGEVKFLSRGRGYSLFLTANQAILAMQGGQKNISQNSKLRSQAKRSPGMFGQLKPANPDVLQMRLVGANTAAKVGGLEELRGKSNYFIGNDPRKWRTNVPTYAKVKYQNVYPGIDLVYYGNQSGQLEYDFIVAPGADPKAIALSVDADPDATSARNRGPVRLDSQGNIILQTEGDDIHFKAPVVYQEDGSGRRQYVNGRYLLSTEKSEVSTITFAITAYDHSRALIIDPAITYSTYLGGSASVGDGGSTGTGTAVFTDSTGHTYAYIAGGTCTSDFPTVNASQSLYGGGCSGYGQPNGDVFVTKFDPSASGAASVIYSTYLGGNGPDGATAIAVDSAGNAYITGITSSTNFPLANAYQSVLKSVAGFCQRVGPNPQNAFLAKLSSDGSTLTYSTYFGGSSCDSANAIALDSAGRAYIAGSTLSPDLPAVNPFQSSLQSPSGNAFVAAFDTTRSGAPSLLYSTYLGGSSHLVGAGGPGDEVQGIAVDSAAGIHLAGYTSSANFPVVNGFQMTWPASGCGYGTAFYAKLNPSAVGAAQLLYSTYLGGCVDTATSVAVDSSGNAYLTGPIRSDVFPVTNSLGSIPTGSSGLGQAFAAKINPSLAGSASLVYFTIVAPADRTPGTYQSGGYGIAVDANGNAFVVGTADPGMPLVNPVQGSANGVMQSINAGNTWTPLTNGLTDFPINTLAIDTSTSPRTLYAGTNLGTIFASSDGGLNWNRTFQGNSPGSGSCGPGNNGGAVCVMAIAVDPTKPSNVYAGTIVAGGAGGAGVYRSLDRGSTWSSFNTGLSTTATQQGVQALAFDNGTAYAGAPDGLYVLTPSANAWSPTNLTVDVGSIAVDSTTTPHTLFTGSSQVGAYRSTDGGATWTRINDPDGFISSLGVDTRPSPSTLYGFDYVAGYNTGLSIWKSVDAGNNWTPTSVQPGGGSVIQIDSTTNPSTIYFGVPNVLKSVDGGNSWTQLTGASLGAIAVDPTTANGITPATVYGATSGPLGNAFVAELNPSGSALVFSTYLGGIASWTGANAIALDGLDNIYVTGATTSVGIGADGNVLPPPTNPISYFPEVNAFQTTAPLTPRNPTAAFFTMFGSQVLPTSSSGNVTAQVGVQTGTLAITLPNISGSTTSSAPTLTVTPLSSSQTANFSLSNNLGAYDISTTASYSGSVTLCFQALTVNDPTTFSNLQLLHVVNGTPVDITSSRNFTTRTVCGTATSLSPFVLFSPTTSTVLGSSLSLSIYGESVTFTATTAGSGGTPTGTVTFYDGANALGTETLNSSGQATLSIASLVVGTHTITAVYGGNGQLYGSTSAAFSETVNKGSTSTMIFASATPSVLNESINLTATVSAVAPASGTPTGNVTFYDGANTMGTATLNSYGQGTLTISSLAVGSHSITAVYAGNSSFGGSRSTGLSQLVQYEPLGTNCLGAAGHQILQPINADGSSVWKQGRTIPAQFRVCDFSGTSVGTPGVVSSFRLTAVLAGTESNVDETVSATNGDAAFHWDSTNQAWVFNIGTTSLAANKTYVYTITLNDGTTITFQYGLR